MQANKKQAVFCLLALVFDCFMKRFNRCRLSESILCKDLFATLIDHFTSSAANAFSCRTFNKATSVAGQLLPDRAAFDPAVRLAIPSCSDVVKILDRISSFSESELSL
ncbi:MAG: hypothetical protein QM308_01135 [Bacillota bacterium]|nr:hypothetical protein [Bacillota bacterium]